MVGWVGASFCIAGRYYNVPPMRHWAGRRSRCHQQKGQSTGISLKAKDNIKKHHHEPADQVRNRDQSPKMAQGAYEKEHVLQVNNEFAYGRLLPIPHTEIGATTRSSVTPLPAVRATLYLAVMFTAFIISFSIVNNLSSTNKKTKGKM